MASAPPRLRTEKYAHGVSKGIACQGCREQKTFCSKQRPACFKCQIRGIDCVYGEPKKITINEELDSLLFWKRRLDELTRPSNHLALKAELRRYKEIFNSLPPDVFSSLPMDLRLPRTYQNFESALPPEEVAEMEDADEDMLCDQFKQMGIYLLASRGSADNMLRTTRSLFGLHGEDQNFDQNPSLYDPYALPSRRQGVGCNITLPPIDIARQYFAAQHMYIGTIFSFSDPLTFETKLKEAYERSPNLHDPHECLAYAKILMILAFGRLYTINRRVDRKDDPPGFSYFAQALTLLPDLHEEGSILCVETLAYVGYFMQNTQRRQAAFLYIGVALRMAIDIGLHQEVVTSVAISEFERERRRRVWWSIYSLDRILSLKSGNPISILDEDISVQMPSCLPQELDNGPVVVLRHYTELSRILGDITSLIYRRSLNTGGSLVANVHSILVSLSRWEDSLPRDLRLELDKGKLPRESISTFLHYYQCINMTARPLLFYVVQKRLVSIRGSLPAGADQKERDWRLGLSKKTETVISGCITAARNTVCIMSRAAEHNLVATFGYMDGEHLFSAAIILVIVCASFPTDSVNIECMHKALQLLQTTGELGNSYVAARYRLLARLQLVLSPTTTNTPHMSTVLDAGTSSLLSRSATSIPINSNITGTTILETSLDEAASARDQNGLPLSLEAGLDYQPYSSIGLEGINTATNILDFNSSSFIEDADSHLWANAFTNAVGLDISQFVHDMDVSSYDL